MIQYHKGSVLEPIGEGVKIIAHVCNTKGGWGKGFVLALSDKWNLPEIAYRDWYRNGPNFVLGAVDINQVADDIAVANIIAQVGYYDPKKNPVPLSYEALEVGLEEVYQSAKENDCTVHMPKIGSGQAKGDWTRIEGLIREIAGRHQIQTTIYEL